MMGLEVKRRVTSDQVRRKRRLEERLARRTRTIFAGIRRDLVETFPALDALPALRPHQNSLQAELETHYRLVQREFESDLPRQLGGSLSDGALPIISAGLAVRIVRRSTFQAERFQIFRGIVGRVVVEMSNRQHHIDHAAGVVLHARLAEKVTVVLVIDLGVERHECAVVASANPRAIFYLAEFATMVGAIECIASDGEPFR